MMRLVRRGAEESTWRRVPPVWLPLRGYETDPYIEILKKKAKKRVQWNLPRSHVYHREDLWEEYRSEIESAPTTVVPTREQRFQSVGIVGMPNAGKSTLVNALMRGKSSSVTRKRHTTTRRVYAVLTEGPNQVEFTDTPGFISQTLGKEEARDHRKQLAREAWWTTEEVNKLIFVVDAAVTNMAKDRTTRNNAIQISNTGKPPILVMNKNFEQIFFTVAENGEGCEALRKYLLKSCILDLWKHSPGQSSMDSISAKLHDIVMMEVLDKIHGNQPYQLRLYVRSVVETENGRILANVDMVCLPGGVPSKMLGKGGELMRMIEHGSETKFSAEMRKPVMIQINFIARQSPLDAYGPPM